MGRTFDATELGGLAKELAQTIPVRARRNIGRGVKQTADECATITRRFARASAGRWGKDYPPAIRSTRIGPTAFRVSPEGKAANWSFEDGSKNQPAHLDHEQGADQVEGRLPLRAQAAAEDAFVGWD
ncbi:hypothetical protein GCM10009737_08290 [Nocardioides lentus]|uniref:HK97 gp10 family phage protein n=1 Tax=Nocardioides lentus TaxID=338077 RepID=A0ABP5AHI8_9ACTN